MTAAGMIVRQHVTLVVRKLGKGAHGGQSCSTGTTVSELACHSSRWHWPGEEGRSTCSLRPSVLTQTRPAADVHVRRIVVSAKASSHLGDRLWLQFVMAPFRQYSFSATGIRSLCWRGDELVDWVGGGRALALDGTERRAPVYYAYHFRCGDGIARWPNCSDLRTIGHEGSVAQGRTNSARDQPQLLSCQCIRVSGSLVP